MAAVQHVDHPVDVSAGAAAGHHADPAAPPPPAAPVPAISVSQSPPELRPADQLPAFTHSLSGTAAVNAPGTFALSVTIRRSLFELSGPGGAAEAQAGRFQRTPDYALHLRRRFLGAVNISRQTLAGRGACVRGDIAPVHFGRCTAIGEDVVVRPPVAVGRHGVAAAPLVLGDNVAVGARAVVEAVSVGCCVVIGRDAIIGARAVVGDAVVVLPDAVVPPSSLLAPFGVYDGDPAVCVRRLDPHSAMFELRDAIQDALLGCGLLLPPPGCPDELAPELRQPNGADCGAETTTAAEGGQLGDRLPAGEV